MTTKQEMINLLKTEFPTLQYGNEEIGYTQLSDNEYDNIINEWADARLVKETQQAEVQAKATARQALLDKLGITADEAKLLLGGN